MKHILFIGLWLLGLGILTAQVKPPTVTVGLLLTDPDKSSLALGKLDLVGLYQDKLYAIDHLTENKRRTVKLSFYIYGQDMALESKQELRVSGERKYRYEKLMMLEDRTYLILSSQERKTNAKIISVQEIDLDKMELIGDMREVATIPFPSRSSWMDVKFEYSPKKNKVLLWCYAGVSSLSDPEMVKVVNTSYLCAFDNTFSPLWQYEVLLPKKVKYAFFLAPTIDEKGIAALVRVRKIYEKNTLVDQEIRAFSIKDGKKINTIELDRKGVWIQQFSFKISLRGGLAFSGFYGKDAEECKGYFYEDYLLYDSNPRRSFFNPFDLSSPQLPKDYLNIQKHLDGDRMIVRDLILKNSSGLVMIAQFGQISTYTDPSGRETSSFVYGDLLLLNIDGYGELVWAERVYQPRSAFPNDWALKSSHANFFFSQSEDEAIRESLTVGSLKNLSSEVISSMQVEMISVNIKGEQSSRVLVPSDGKGHRLYPFDRFIQVDNTIIIKGLEGKSAHYIKLDFH